MKITKVNTVESTLSNKNHPYMQGAWETFYDEFNALNNYLTYDQLMEWDKDDLAHHILSYQEEARRTKNQAKYPY